MNELINEGNAAHSDEQSRPRPTMRRILVVSIIAALTLVGVGVSVWAAATEAQRAAAQDAHTDAVATLLATQADAEAARENVGSADATLLAELDVADAIAAVLAHPNDASANAVEATASVRDARDARENLREPSRSAGTPAEDADAAAYEALTDATVGLQNEWSAYRDALNERLAETHEQHRLLAEAWQALAETAPGTADGIVEANPNASQAAKDAVLAAAAAIEALDNPLAPEAVDLWAALAATAHTAAEEERVFQEQKAAAEAEAARTATRNPARSGSSSVDRGCQSASCYTGPSLEALQAQRWAEIVRGVAERQGVPVSSVNCYIGGKGIRCDYPGGYSETWIGTGN